MIIWCSVNFLHSDCCCAFLVDPGGTTFTLAHSSETCMCLELASGPAAFTFWQMEQPSFLFWQISHEYNFFFLSLKICVVQHSGKSSKISMSLSPCSLLSSPERLVLSRIVAMNIASHTTRGHSSTTWTFTQLQITHRLHFPSFTAPTQLFTIITLAPVHYHPITHTHYINPEPSATLCRVLFSPATLQSVFPVFPVWFPVFWFCPCSWNILSA